jgi:hypothetical protein
MRKAQQKPQGRLGGCGCWFQSISNHDLGSSSQLGKVKQQAVAMVTKSHFGNNHGYLTQNNQRDFSRQHVDFIKKKDFTSYPLVNIQKASKSY